MHRSPNRTFRGLLTILAGAVTLYVAFVFVMSLTFRSLLYPAPVDLGGPTPPGAELRTLRANDGKEVHALHFRNATARDTLVHFHGNGDTVRSMGGVATDLHARGFAVLLVEYRGYGSSRASGPPQEKGLYLDAEAALDALAHESERACGADPHRARRRRRDCPLRNGRRALACVPERAPRHHPRRAARRRVCPGPSCRSHRRLGAPG